MEKKHYRLPLVWESWGILEVAADSLGEAATYAVDPESPLPDRKEYVDGSVQIDWEAVNGIGNDLSPEDLAFLEKTKNPH